MGRLLIEYSTIDSKNPEMKLKKVDTNDVEFSKRLEKMEEKSYQI